MIKAIHDNHARFMISVWGKFYPDDGEREGAGGDRRALYQPTLTAGTRDWLQRTYAFYDVFNAPRAQDVLGAGEQGALQQGRRRLVDGRDRARHRAAVAADARGAAPRHRHDGDRHGVARDERVLAREQPGGLRRPAPRGARSARLHPDPLGLRRHPALRAPSPGRATSRRSGRRCASRSPPGSASRSPGIPYWTTDTGGYTMQRAVRAQRRASGGARSTNGASSTRAGSSTAPSRRSCACTAPIVRARCGTSATRPRPSISRS